jgi:putative nucleotidyltransferase with HDIG domain
MGTLKGTMKLPSLQAKAPYLIAICALGLLTGFIVFLVGYNYVAHVKLQNSISNNYRQRVERDAISLSYFFSERKDDLKSLPARREIAIFFENLALGMSMQYGLSASLDAVKSGFEFFQEERRLDGKRVYTRMVFIDRFGKRLVDSDLNPAEPGEENWDRFLTPDLQSPVIVVQNLTDPTQVIVSSPFFFKGNYSGQILGWIAPATINGYFFDKLGETPHNLAQIFSVQDNFYLPFQPNIPNFPDIFQMKQGKMHRFTQVAPGEGQLEMIAEWAPIAGTPLGLVEAMPTKELLGSNSPGYLLLVMGSLSTLFLLGIGLIWRMNNRNLALHIYLEGEVLRQQEIQKKNQQLNAMIQQTVTTISAILEMRDPYTAGHQQRVTQLACTIAQAMGLSEDRIEGLRVAGFLHDVGKIVVPAEILNRPGKLSDNEYNIIKTHSFVGYEILKEIEFPWPVAQIVLQHHERLDGSGYPDGVTGDNIFLESLILMVADVVEAISAHRPYRPALGIDKALEEITRNKGILYDPEVAEVCVKLFTEKGFSFEK